MCIKVGVTSARGWDDLCCCYGFSWFLLCFDGVWIIDHFQPLVTLNSVPYVLTLALSLGCSYVFFVGGGWMVYVSCCPAQYSPATPLSITTFTNISTLERLPFINRVLRINCHTRFPSLLS